MNDRIRVVDEDDGPRRRARAATRSGWSAMGGRIPLGYYKDPEKTAATFRIVDGVRYSIPGDYATVDADGTVRLLGRGSACINTGGEKVYPEEVEAALREHPGVFDCVVVGVPDERFGEQVVALVQVTDGDDLDEAELVAWCRARWPGTRRRAASCSSTRCRARPRARRTTASCARSRSSCSPTTPPRLTGSRGRAQAPRASGAVQLQRRRGNHLDVAARARRPGRGRCAWPRRARRRPRP